MFALTGGAPCIVIAVKVETVIQAIDQIVVL